MCDTQLIMRHPSAWRAEGPLIRSRKLEGMFGAWSCQSVLLDHITLDVANSLDRACSEGGLRGRRKAFGLGIGGLPRMEGKGARWVIGTRARGGLGPFWGIRGAQRLTMWRDFIQTHLVRVSFFP